MPAAHLTTAILSLAAALYPSQEKRTESVLSGPRLIREGRLEEALQGYVKAVAESPKSVAANNGAGVSLDLMGRYAEAQKYFAQAIKAAPTAIEKAQAERAMAISYGFAGDCRGVEKYDRTAYDFFQAVSDSYDAGEVADELARLCLDLGSIDTAYNWYRKGYEAGIQERNISPAHVSLWDFRWAHARARIAVRRGKPEDAAKYVVMAKAILNKGNNPDQQIYFPYLAGYVAFYSGDYADALADLRDASQTDPFIQRLMAQCYEKLGDAAKALAYYREAASSTAHSVPAALARPFALRKLQLSGAPPR